MVTEEIKKRASAIDPALKHLDDMGEFIESLATHQAAAIIISKDYNCSLKAGAHMAWLSEPYGEREFPLDSHELSLLRLRSDLKLTKDTGSKVSGP